jgi:hypothetical protein
VRGAFGTYPVAICHEWNTIAHLNDYEGSPEARPFTREELQRFLDYADEQVERAVRSRRKGALAAYRDATIFKVIYGWGLRRTETARLDVADFGRNPRAPQFGRYGTLNVRYGKAKRGQPPRRRNVLSVMGWAVEAVTDYAENVLEALGQAAARPDGRRRIARAVADRPGLLTGQGARAEFPGVLRFISALVKAGAVAVVEPPCPRCGRQKQLSALVDGLRLCAGCVKKARALRCGRCGAVRSPARRNDNGQPICQNCWRRDPRSWKPCAKRGNCRRVAAITGAGPVCQSCRPGPAVACSICGSAGSRIGMSQATRTRCVTGAANAGSPARAAAPARR